MGKEITFTLIRVLGSFVAIFIPIWAVMPIDIAVGGTIPPTIVRIDNPSPQVGAQFGGAVAGIGDINDDGIGDLAVGAPGADRVYLLSGADQSVILTLEDPDLLSGYSFGFSVRGVGDISGDEVEDVAVGAPNLSGGLPVPDPDCSILNEDPPPICDAPFGRAFVFSGSTGEVILRPESQRFLFGFAVAPLGDVNNDGFRDIAVSAPFLMNNLGGVYAFSGYDGSLLWETVEPEPEPSGGTQPIASFGMYMAGVHDLNGDAVLLVAAPFSCYDCDPSTSALAGKGYVLLGTDGNILRTHENNTPVNNDFFGGGPGAIGDLDEDGIEDYAFGEARSGVVYFYSGADGSSILTIEKPDGGNSDFFGFQIAKVDDKDGDGLEDFWIAAPDDTFVAPADGGTAYLMNSIGDVLIQVDDPNPVSLGDQGFGWSISPTEDLDGDGGLDLIVGKPVESVEGFGSAGAVYLLLGVRPNNPPIANAGSDQTVSVGPDCMANVTLDGSGSTDPDGHLLTYEWKWNEQSAAGINPSIRLPLGTSTITLFVNDGIEDSEPDTVTVTVIDDTPPDLSVSVSPDILWPPNHKMTHVTVEVDSIDNCDLEATCQIQSVGSNEPVHGSGDRNTVFDWEVTGDLTVDLRAERAGSGDGRVYDVTVECTDASGNWAQENAQVTVPHDQGKKKGKK